MIFFFSGNLFQKLWLFSSKEGSAKDVRQKKFGRSGFTFAGEGVKVGSRAQNLAFFSVKILIKCSGDHRRLKLGTYNKLDQTNANMKSKNIYDVIIMTYYVIKIEYTRNLGSI